jgi:hypothetical protein
MIKWEVNAEVETLLQVTFSFLLEVLRP